MRVKPGVKTYLDIYQTASFIANLKHFLSQILILAVRIDHFYFINTIIEAIIFTLRLSSVCVFFPIHYREITFAVTPEFIALAQLI